MSDAQRAMALAEDQLYQLVIAAANGVVDHPDENHAQVLTGCVRALIYTVRAIELLKEKQQ